MTLMALRGPVLPLQHLGMKEMHSIATVILFVATWTGPPQPLPILGGCPAIGLLHMTHPLPSSCPCLLHLSQLHHAREGYIEAILVPFRFDPQC